MTDNRDRIRRALAVLALLLLAGSARAQTPSGLIISEVIPKNNHTTPTRRIVSQLREMRPGRQFSSVGARSDVERLMKSGNFRNVNVATKVTEDNKVQVFVTVEEFPNTVTEIYYSGAEHISLKKLSEITGLRRGEPMNPVRNRIARDAILRQYRDDGRTFAQVHLREGANLTDRRIVFEITEGPVVKVDAVRFEGNTTVSDSTLKNRIDSSSAIFNRIGGRYVPAQVEMDVVKLKEYYKAIGFQMVRVQHELERSPDMARVTLVFHIDEGPRHVIKSVQLDGNKIYDNKALMSQIQAKPNEYYDSRVVQADMQNIKNYYGHRGHLVPVKEEVILDPNHPGHVHLSYQVAEQQAVRAGTVTIQGNTVTRDDVIREQLGIFPGQVLSFPAILQAEANLARLGIFNNQQTGERPRISVLEPLNPDDPIRDIVVTVEEQPTGSVLFGGGVNSDAGLSAAPLVHHRDATSTSPGSRPASEDLLQGPGLPWRRAGTPHRGGARQRCSSGTRSTFREPTLFNTPNSLDRRAATSSPRGYAGVQREPRRRAASPWAGRSTATGPRELHHPRGERGHSLTCRRFRPASRSRQDIGDDFLLGFLGVAAQAGHAGLVHPSDRPAASSRPASSRCSGIERRSNCCGNVGGTIYRTAFERIDGSGKPRRVHADRRSSFAGDEHAGVRAVLRRRLPQPYAASSSGGSARSSTASTPAATFAFLNTLQYELPVLPSDRLFLVGFLDSGAIGERFGVKFDDYRVSAGIGFRIAVPGMGPVPLAFDFAWDINKAPGDREQLFSFYLAAFR